MSVTLKALDAGNFPFRSARSQIHALGEVISALRRSELTAQQWAESLGDTLQPRTTLGVILGSVYYPHSTPGVLESWRKASGWQLQTPIRNLKESFLKYDASHFMLDERTANALRELERFQGTNKFLITPIRIAPFNEDLEVGEFAFDLASTIWILIGHWPKLLHLGKLMLAADGERYESNGSFTDVPVAGFEEGHLRVYTKRPESLTGYMKLVGRGPVQDLPTPV